MQSSHCLNCGEALTPVQKYCSACGQKRDIKPITYYHLLQEFFQTITNFDKGLLHLSKGLATDPGRVAVHYIAGKRKQYFNPFGFLAICIAISLFVSNMIRPHESLPTPDYINISRMPTEKLKELAQTSKERASSVEDFTNKNMNILTVLITPYVAFMLWLFYRKRRRNMPEIALAYIFFSGFGMLFTTLVVYPLMLLFKSYTAFNVLVWISMILQTLYYAWGFKILFGYKTTREYIKILLSLLLIGLIGMIIVVIFLFYYVYGGSWDLLYYLSQPKNVTSVLVI